ncbi:MAG: hypothetical protein KDK66_05470 [Deltaproteobacteria bacterium]|nr:hypothetical protein [Deltaproteobacteria bacterium]
MENKTYLYKGKAWQYVLSLSILLPFLAYLYFIHIEPKNFIKSKAYDYGSFALVAVFCLFALLRLVKSLSYEEKITLNDQGISFPQKPYSHEIMTINLDRIEKVEWREPGDFNYAWMSPAVLMIKDPQKKGQIFSNMLKGSDFEDLCQKLRKKLPPGKMVRVECS